MLNNKKTRYHQRFLWAEMIFTLLNISCFVVVPDLVLASGKNIPKEDISALMSKEKPTRSPPHKIKKTDEDSFEEVKKLFESDNQSDKEKGGEILCNIAQSGLRKNSWDAAKLLFQKGVLSHKEIGRKVLSSSFVSLKKEIEALVEGWEESLILYIHIANTLIERGNEEDTKIALQAINDIYEKARHSFCFKNNDAKSRRYLQLIASHENPLSSEALFSLLTYDKEDSPFSHNPLNFRRTSNQIGFSLSFPIPRTLPASGKFAHSLHISRMLGFAKKGQYEEVESFYKYYHPCIQFSEYGEQMSAYLKGLNYIMQHIDHPKRYVCAKILYQQRKDFSESAKEVLREISEQRDHVNQKEALETLGNEWGCLIM